MREPIRDKERLQHIIDAINTILIRVEGMNLEALTADKIVFGGIVYYTMIIGEATYKLTHAFTSRHPEVPWQSIISMRHHIVHGYYQVDARILWDIIQNDLRPLKAQVEKILSETDWDEWQQQSTEA